MAKRTETDTADAEADEVEPADAAAQTQDAAASSPSAKLALRLKERRAKAAARTRRIPRLPGWAAAAGTGLVVGLVCVLLVAGGMWAFQETLKTPAGDGYGVAALALVLFLAMLTGRLLLGARGLPDSLATSVIGVLFMLIVTMAALIGVIFSDWMWLVIPLLGAASYAAAYGITSKFGSAGRS